MKLYNTADLIRFSPLLSMMRVHHDVHLPVGMKTRYEQEKMWVLEDTTRTTPNATLRWFIPDQDVQMTQPYVIVEAHFGDPEGEPSSWVLYLKQIVPIKPVEFDSWIAQAQREESLFPRKK